MGLKGAGLSIPPRRRNRETGGFHLSLSSTDPTEFSPTDPTETPATTTTAPSYAQSCQSNGESQVSVLSLETVTLAYTSTATTREEVVTELVYVAG